MSKEPTFLSKFSKIRLLTERPSSSSFSFLSAPKRSDSDNSAKTLLSDKKIKPFHNTKSVDNITLKGIPWLIRKFSQKNCGKTENIKPYRRSDTSRTVAYDGDPGFRSKLHRTRHETSIEMTDKSNYSNLIPFFYNLGTNFINFSQLSTSI